MSLKKVMISQAHQCLGERLGIIFHPGILAFTFETQKLTRIEYIAIRGAQKTPNFGMNEHPSYSHSFLVY